MSNLKEKIKKLPDKPGVYIFKKGKNVLYIGKATSLKDRVKSYFAKDIAFTRSLLIENMVQEANNIEWIETDSVLEALILEANLIKKHKPKYNTKEKDDKSFNFLVITDEKYPRVFTMRSHDIQKLGAKSQELGAIYGPYPQGGSLKEALKIVRKIFPFRGEKEPISPRSDLGERGMRRSYLNEEIGLSPKFSKGVDKKEYTKTIKNIQLFFEGKTSKVLKNLKKEMKEFVNKQEFEKADEIKRKIFALTHINDLALIKEQKISSSNFRIEAYDVAHISGKERVGVMVVVDGGVPKKNAYRKFKINPHTFHSTVSTESKRSKNSGMKGVGVKDKGDTWALAQILERRLNHPEWALPKLITVDGGKAQKNTAERILAKFGYQIPVVAVVKGDGHKPKNIFGKREIIVRKEADILLANNEAHRFAIKWHREKMRKNLK